MVSPVRPPRRVCARRVVRARASAARGAADRCRWLGQPGQLVLVDHPERTESADDRDGRERRDGEGVAVHPERRAKPEGPRGGQQTGVEDAGRAAEHGGEHERDDEPGGAGERQGGDRGHLQEQGAGQGERAVGAGGAIAQDLQAPPALRLARATRAEGIRAVGQAIEMEAGGEDRTGHHAHRRAGVWAQEIDRDVGDPRDEGADDEPDQRERGRAVRPVLGVQAPPDRPRERHDREQRPRREDPADRRHPSMLVDAAGGVVPAAPIRLLLAPLTPASANVAMP